jgi:hypothetical protein
MAAFVASCCKEGEQVAKDYCNVPAKWATELEQELSCLKQSSSSLEHQTSEHREMAQKGAEGEDQDVSLPCYYRM